MPEEKVDPNRASDCSHGLHICSSSYIPGYGGNAITLVKIAAEDVIAVPQYNTNKMRVSRYQIVAELPTVVHDRLKKGAKLTSDKDGSKILQAVIAGDHVAAFERVIDPGDRGEVQVVPLQQKTSKPRRRRAKDVVVGGAVIDVKTLQSAFAQALDMANTQTVQNAINKAIESNGKTTPAQKPKVSKPVQKVEESSGDKVAFNSAVTRASDGAIKLVEAQRLKNGGWSLREIEKHLGMCRKSLAKKLI
jgi:hypothetical protein